MRDDLIFEVRLADAFGRLADAGPDDGRRGIARDAIATGGVVGEPVGRRPCDPGGSVCSHPGQVRRVAYLLIVFAVVLATILVALAGGAFRINSLRPLARNGSIAFTVQGNNHEAPGTHLMNAGRDRRPPARVRSLPRPGPATGAPWRGCPTTAPHPSWSGTRRVRPSTRSFSSNAHRLPCPSPSPRTGGESPGSSRRRPVRRRAAGSRRSPVIRRPASCRRRPSRPRSQANRRTGRRRRPHRVRKLCRERGYRGAPPNGDLRRRRGWSEPPPCHGPARRPRRRDGVVAGWPFHRLPGRAGRAGRLSVGERWVAGWLPARRRIRDRGRRERRSERHEHARIRAPAGVVTGRSGAGLRYVGRRRSSPADHDPHERTDAGRSTRPGPETEWFVWSPDGSALLWLEVSTPSPETYHSTIHSIDPEFRQPPKTLRAVDGLIVCAPSWQRLEP